MNFQKIVRLAVQSRNVVQFSTLSSDLRNIGKSVLVGHNTHTRQLCPISTYEVKEINRDEGFVKKLLKKLPFLGINRAKLKAQGYFLYEGIADRLDYIKFFDKYDLPDTFYSWFVITELHIWMLSIRAMAEGDEGKFLRNSIVEALWNDVGPRVKKLGAGSMRPQLIELSEQMQASLVAYDEGLQSDDIVLTGALWRRFYQMRDVHISDLEELVKYVRKQVAMLDSLSHDQLFHAEVRWK